MSERAFYVTQFSILITTLIIFMMGCFISTDLTKRRAFELEKLNCLKKHTLEEKENETSILQSKHEKD